MAVSLSNLPAPRSTRSESKSSGPLRYDGPQLMADVRLTLRRRARAVKLSEHERDSLVQSLALRALETGSLVKPDGMPRDRAERMVILRRDLADLLRDSRAWRDSADGWRPRERTERTAAGGRKGKLKVTVALTVAEQAERYRSWEREHDERVSMTSTDALAERWTVDDENRGEVTDWLGVDADRQREREAGEGLPASAVAEHNRVLTRSLARSLAAAHSLSESDLRAALYCHAGESLVSVAQSERVSIATAKRRSTRGTKAIRDKIGRDELATARRTLAVELGLVPPDSGPILGESALIALAAVNATARPA